VKVLGIDPGTAACGYGIVHANGGRLKATCHGWWGTPARERPELRLRTIFDGVRELIAEHAPDALALEESYVGADARIALSVGQARGAVLVAASSVRADKQQVQRMVKAILALDEIPRPNHAADALAVAICHALAPPLLRAVS
jgi:crossover junction endodeoxyribonuclease RuvC